MGGIGKTQTAAAFARGTWDSGGVELLVWVRAAERQSIIVAYAAAAVQVCRADPSDSRSAANTFLAWLDRPNAPRTAGDATAAVAELREVLLDFERVLGPEHPDIRDTRKQLEWWGGELLEPRNWPRTDPRLLTRSEVAEMTTGQFTVSSSRAEGLLTDPTRLWGEDEAPGATAATPLISPT